MSALPAKVEAIQAHGIHAAIELWRWCRRVSRKLAALVERRGKPDMIVSDNGTEFTGKAILKCANENGVEWHYIDPVKPRQNGFIESLNGGLRNEC